MPSGMQRTAHSSPGSQGAWSSHGQPTQPSSSTSPSAVSQAVSSSRGGTPSSPTKQPSSVHAPSTMISRRISGHPPVVVILTKELADDVDVADLVETHGHAGLGHVADAGDRQRRPARQTVGAVAGDVDVVLYGRREHGVGGDATGDHDALERVDRDTGDAIVASG